MRRIFVLFLLLSCLVQVWGQVVVLSGHVLDADTRQPLVGATVIDQDSKVGCITDTIGKFSLRLSGEAPFDLTASYTGFRQESLIVGNDTLFVEFCLEKDNLLPNVTVYGSRDDVGTSSSQMSAVSLSVSEIKSIPSYLGEPDVLKGLQKLPGVTTANEGQAGIYVRGGNIDQNLITLDGSTLYNAEHLKGFVSALNSDMIDNVTFYSGAFPARYGSRLSSVIDVGIKEGDFYDYHGTVSLGMLSSRVQAEGPLWKGHTSFNVGMRFSYFDFIMMPILKDMYLHPDALNPYANMDYYDISAKIVHKFSSRDKLSAVFYLGNDVCDESPNTDSQTYLKDDEKKINTQDNRSENRWGNIVSSLYWTHQSNERLLINSNLSFSRYYYKIGHVTEEREEIFEKKEDDDGGVVWRKKSEDSFITSIGNRSEINDWAFATDFRFFCNDSHTLRWGAKLSYQKFEPVIDTYMREYEWDKGTETIDVNSGQMGEVRRVTMVAAYAEDDWAITSWLKANLGLRYTLAATDGKNYQLLEPRVSLRWLLSDGMALKASYSRVSQNLHRLNTNNLLFATDLWVPITENIPLMKADQWAIGYSYDLPFDLTFMLEGYYKNMKNLLEYRDGAGYMAGADNWEKQVAVGNGRSFGAEVLLRRQSENTDGWISYTWSKALRKFDRNGNVVNNGDEFYAMNDRRHNFNMFVSHRFPSGWKVSTSWTYQTGRCGTIASIAAFGGNMEDYTDGNSEWSSVSGKDVLRIYVSERNNYRLPPVHRLDFSVSYILSHGWGESDFNVTLYNVYNRMNISNVYIGYEDKRPVLKGICIFPFMPSFTYTLKF